MVINCNEECKCQSDGRCFSGNGHLIVVNPFTNYPVKCKNTKGTRVTLVMDIVNDNIHTVNLDEKATYYNGE